MRSITVLLLLTVSAQGASPDTPTYRAQGDRHLTGQPFISSLRGLVIEFYPHGMYRLDSIAGGKEVGRGAYGLYENVLVLNPDTDKKMTCRYSVDQYDDLGLSDCAYEGVWKPLRVK